MFNVGDKLKFNAKGLWKKLEASLGEAKEDKLIYSYPLSLGNKMEYSFFLDKHYISTEERPGALADGEYGIVKNIEGNTIVLTLPLYMFPFEITLALDEVAEFLVKED